MRRTTRRWLLIRDRKEGTAEDAVPIRAVFEIDDGDVQAIEELVGAGVVETSDLHASREYDGTLRLSVAPDEPKAVANLVKADWGLDGD